MLNDSKTDEQSVAGTVAGVSRRSLVRAGLAAAPVMMAIKSKSALAGGDVCVKPSAFSSIKANSKLSHAPNQDWTCKSHGYWKNHNHPSPYDTKIKSFFLTKTPLLSGEVSAGFTRNPSDAYTGKTLQQVLVMGANDDDTALARHVVGTFLTAVANGDNANIVLLTTWQCKQIWDLNGNWSPVSGQVWDKAMWLDYFKYIYP